MVDTYGNSVAFVIDTDSYAGNFEREMCAHVVGHYGDCEVGKEMVQEGIPEQFENVIQMSDDHACYRPTTCFPLKDQRDYNAVAIFFDDMEPPTKKQIDLMKERAETFLLRWQTEGRLAEFNKDKVINITGFRLIKFETNTTQTEL